MSVPAAWVALSLIEHLGGRRLHALMAAFGGDVGAVLAADEAELQRVPGIGPKLAAAIRGLDLDTTARAMRRWHDEGVILCAVTDPTYPDRLRDLGPDAPPMLFLRGDAALLKHTFPAAALIGTRQPSSEAREAAFRLGMELAGRDWAVVSGLAAGIDAAAHHGALAGRGRTIAMLGSGVLQIFPPGHEDLAALLLRHGGLLVSEVSPDARASTPRLVARNRLISALSDAVLIIETAADGGAMHAARAARAQGRALYTLNLPATGNEALIQEGARVLAVNARADEVVKVERDSTPEAQRTQSFL